jgi:Arm DNA-binding domain
MRKVLTDVFVRTLPAPVIGRTEMADVRAAGLEFRVTAKGVRSWSFRFRDPRSGKPSRATIGDYPPYHSPRPGSERTPCGVRSRRAKIRSR